MKATGKSKFLNKLNKLNQESKLDKIEHLREEYKYRVIERQMEKFDKAELVRKRHNKQSQDIHKQTIAFY